MTAPKPKLQLTRLVVTCRGRHVYDEKFGAGVNIIRGENSSGKSTIADMLAYCLGAEIKQWSPEALRCDQIFGEFEINERKVTFSRRITETAVPPIEVFEGNFDDGLKDKGAWLSYPMKRSSNTESFSQIAFNLLGFPEISAENAQNITMHQVLRLIYCDQITPVTEIFKQDRFDQQDLRIAVSELLLGVDDLDVHAMRSDLRKASRQFDQIHGELKSLFSVLGKTEDSDITVFEIDSAITELETERHDTLNEIDKLINSVDKESLARSEERAQATDSEVRSTRNAVQQCLDSLATLDTEIEESSAFLEAIEYRLAALDASQDTVNVLGQISFEFCPVCLSAVPDEPNSESCYLCKNEFDEQRASSGYLKMRDELVFQKRESTFLLKERVERKRKLQNQINLHQENLEQLVRKRSEYQRAANPIDAEQRNLYMRLGYIDRNREDLLRKKELAEIVGKLIEDKKSLQTLITDLETRIEAREAAREKRKDKVWQRVSELALELLDKDLQREEAFHNAEELDFSFEKNRIAVGGRTRFSASSTTYLKNCFLLSLFLFSIEDDECLWPRFSLLDNIEDKGMAPERSANFQKIAIEYTEAKIRDFGDAQLIFTTSMISPEFDGTEYCVGPKYSNAEKTLDFSEQG